MDFANSINTPLDIETLKVVSQEIDNKGEITINVLSRKNYGSCHICGKSATKSNGTAPERVVRHLPIFGKAVYLRITPNRPSCGDCAHHSTTTGQCHWLFFNFLQDRRRALYILEKSVAMTATQRRAMVVTATA